MSHLGKNYTGHPTVQIGTKVMCINRVPENISFDGTIHMKGDEFFVDAHNINYYRYYTPGHYEVVQQPKRTSK